MICKENFICLSEADETCFRQNLLSPEQVENDIYDFLINSFEKVIIEGFNSFKGENNTESYYLFSEELLKTNWNYLYNKYPLLQFKIENNREKTNKSILHVLKNFQQDFKNLNQCFLLDKIEKINSFKFGLGDFHNGLSTSLLCFSENKKIVFKPTKGGITLAYHDFLDIIDTLLPLGKYRYNVLCKNDYHWLEFINLESFKESSDLNLYYERVGYLLCITYVLNSTDFHHENLIVNEISPVLIDHETIIQPKINKNIESFFKSFDNGMDDTVIKSMLLPNHFRTSSSMPLGSCGIGYYREKEIKFFQNESIGKFTDDWKIIPKFSTVSLEKENIPQFEGKTVHANDYLNDILLGFEKCYHLFLDNRDIFKSKNNCPVNKFDNQNIRFIWRPTNIYSKILDLMKLPKNLKEKEEYERKFEINIRT